ncbi:class I SAM-dependent methyltransferase [Lichenifustis flavocetrariae]|uniref:Methyltransferase domain-containing protein n=1 Tax=Lichenifustis flavocetrariae TaxID=2949735 RepID=A0AA42CM08_9HYPH|nr:methyltransferase domain-containing protein [Lichenifustis flavocetrariae]MCW6511026.1 methyltransferase domain-containing protein [Lichenifustis flavocetrariae]
MTDDARLAKATISDASQVVSAYARWAPVYDLVFEFVMRAGRQAAVAALGARPGRVLDVGIGTGLELPLFSPQQRVTGIDLAEPMLRRAQTKAARGPGNVDGLCVMDAARLAFPDASFDAVIAPYVLTVVPDPDAMLDEIDRVVKPGGDVVLVNHFGASQGPIAAIEAWLGKRAASLGWHPQFPFAVLGDWLAKTPDMVLTGRRTVGVLNLFTVVTLRKRGADPQG